MSKAEQFLGAAEMIRRQPRGETDAGDAYVTLLVHAGIAAADVTCCRELGEHASGDSHSGAVALLRRVRHDGGELARALETLLAVKTRAGYTDQPVAKDARIRSARAAERLVRAARDRRF